MPCPITSPSISGPHRAPRNGLKCLALKRCNSLMASALRIGGRAVFVSLPWSFALARVKEKAHKGSRWGNSNWRAASERDEDCSQRGMNGTASSRETRVPRTDVLFQCYGVVSLSLTRPTHHRYTIIVALVVARLRLGTKLVERRGLPASRDAVCHLVHLLSVRAVSRSQFGA